MVGHLPHVAGHGFEQVELPLKVLHHHRLFSPLIGSYYRLRITTASSSHLPVTFALIRSVYRTAGPPARVSKFRGGGRPYRGQPQQGAFCFEVERA